MRRRARGRVVTGRQSVLVVMVLLGPATAAEVGERPADYRRVAQQAEVAAAAASTAVPSAGRGTPARVVPDHGGRSGRGHLVLVRGLLLVVLGGESGQNRVTVVGVLLLLLLLLGKVVVLVVGRASSSGQVAEAHIHIGKQRSEALLPICRALMMLLLQRTASQPVLKAGVMGEMVCQRVLLLHLLGHYLVGKCVEW